MRLKLAFNGMFEHVSMYVWVSNPFISGELLIYYYSIHMYSNVLK